MHLGELDKLRVWYGASNLLYAPTLGPHFSLTVTCINIYAA